MEENVRGRGEKGEKGGKKEEGEREMDKKGEGRYNSLEREKETHKRK